MAEKAPRITCPECGARVTVRKASTRHDPTATHRQVTRHYSSAHHAMCPASGRREDELVFETHPQEVIVNGRVHLHAGYEPPVMYEVHVPVVKRERPLEVLRQYAPEDAGKDGYPREWHNIDGSGRGIKHLVRADAGDRCVRCGHPYTQGDGQWSRCDEFCEHGGPARDLSHPFGGLGAGTTTGGLLRESPDRVIEAEWRVLTVHHLDEDKLNCRWWNLAALCQRDHLLIQRKVVMARPWPWPHTEWFKPYAAGYYAWKYAHLEITREQAMAELESWLWLGQRSEAVERMPL